MDHTETTDSRCEVHFEIHRNRNIIARTDSLTPGTFLYDGINNSVLSGFLKDFRDKKLRLQLEKTRDGYQLHSSKTFLVNGVGQRSRFLKNGDRIHLGEYRLIFRMETAEVPPQEPPKKTSRKRIVRGLEAAAVVLSLSVLWYCATSGIHTEKTAEESVFPAESHETEPAYSNSEELDELEDHPYMRDQDKQVDIPGVLTAVVYGPDESPGEMKLDVLFIHTHPDDESLDYGLFLSKLESEGKKTGIILLTDGESGLDSYPDRPVDGIYPDRYMKGKELSSVRVREAERAMGVLGTDVYVRFGFINRPYTAEEVNKSQAVLIEEWGGEEAIVGRLVSCFDKFRPDYIVSPDGPGAAREHFEHEAAGYLAEKAVFTYLNDNPGKLKAYLKLVDVQQTDAYPEVELMELNPGESSSFVENKRKALMMHRTQNDASYFGIKRLDEYPFEFYMVGYASRETDMVFAGKNADIQLP